MLGGGCWRVLEGEERCGAATARVFGRWCNWQPELWWKRRGDEQAESRRAGRGQGEAKGAQHPEDRTGEQLTHRGPPYSAMDAAECMALGIVQAGYWPTRAGASVFNEDASGSVQGFVKQEAALSSSSSARCSVCLSATSARDSPISSRPCPSRPPGRVVVAVRCVAACHLLSALRHRSHPPPATRPPHPRTRPSPTVSLPSPSLGCSPLCCLDAHGLSRPVDADGHTLPHGLLARQKHGWRPGRRLPPTPIAGANTI